MSIRLLFQLVLLLIIVAAGCRDDQVQAPEIKVPLPLLGQSDQQKAGARLFFKHCRECHGTAGEGRNPRAALFVPLAPDFISHKYLEVEPEYLYWRIVEGKRVEPYYSQGSVMPAWGPHFSRQQLWQLVAYLRHRAERNR